MVVIQIDDQADRVQAVGILADAGETYHCAPGNRFIVSNRVPALLHEGDVRFRILGRRRPEEGQEPENVTNA